MEGAMPPELSVTQIGVQAPTDAGSDAAAEEALFEEVLGGVILFATSMNSHMINKYMRKIKETTKTE
jgi:hypothetical protein